MIAGVHGLASLDGAPLDERDRATIFAGAMDGIWTADGCLFGAREPDESARHVTQGEDEIALLLGVLDEPGAVADSLNMPDQGNQARLAVAAHDRWGPEIARRLAGEWLLVRWDIAARTLTVAASACLRDFCYVATDGRRAALAPNLPLLARLDWVDAQFDPEMLLLAMSRGDPGRALRRRTVLAGVQQLLPGECVTVRLGDVRIVETPPEPVPPLVATRFEDAMDEIDHLLRGAMRRELARSGDVTLLLSGGLDSSLLAWLAATERRAGQALTFLTSAAPDGSGLPDESDWAERVARHLDVPLVRVAPDPSADIYRVRPYRAESAAGPSLSPRHYLYDAFEDLAASIGAVRIIDGAFGEMTVSNHGFFLGRPAPRSPLRRVVHGARRLFARSARDSLDGFQVQLAGSVLAGLPAPEALPPPQPDARALPGAPFGFEPGFDKAAYRSTRSSDPQVRYHYPFRNRRLGSLMAGLPAIHVAHDGIERAPIRALMRGRLPDRIVDRETKRPFSPTYYQMLAAHAPAAIARIPAQRAAGAGEWLDLDWLERTLTLAHGRAALSHQTFWRLQATALAAEFFSWWQSEVRGT